MLAFLGAVVRIVLGFLVACLAAGFIQVLFAVTPAELVVAGEARWSAALNWALLSSAHIAVFAAPFALISIIISEWLGIRSFSYHTIIAMGIAVAGFGLIMMMEAPSEASIVNSYAMAAYLTSGFIAGFVYWLLSGRLALRRYDEEPLAMDGDFRPSPAAAPPSQPAHAQAAQRSTGTVPAMKPAGSPTSPPPASSSQQTASPRVVPQSPTIATGIGPERAGTTPNASGSSNAKPN
jgi:hypothetical protein